MYALLGVIGFLGIIVGIVMFIMSLIKKKKKKNSGLVILASFIIVVIALAITPVAEEEANKSEKVVSSTQKVKETAEEKQARETKEAEEKAVAEQKAKEEAEAEAKAKEERIAKEIAEKQATLDALKFSGTGDSATGRFTLDDGFVIIESTHNGSSNFALELLDKNGNPVELVVNEIGSYQGKQAYEISAGEYLYNVSASGAWTIQMSQYIPDEILTGNASGKGDSVVFMNVESGARTISMTHDGSSNFAIIINDRALIANEIGTYKGSQIQKFEDSSVYFFTITADGNWTLNIE